MDHPRHAPPTDSLGLIAAEIFVDKVLSDKRQPLVMFALEDCSRSEQARMILIDLNAPYRSIDLNAATYQKRRFGDRVRAVIHLRTGCDRLPKIFLAGTLLGGYVELLEASGDGRLTPLIGSAASGADLQR